MDFELIALQDFWNSSRIMLTLSDVDIKAVIEKVIEKSAIQLSPGFLLLLLRKKERR